MTAVLIVLDGVGAGWVTRKLMPTLFSWGESGAIRPQGADAVLCSATYPNIASIVTGALPIEHGLFANDVVVDGTIRSGAGIGPRVSTLLDEESVVVVGDQSLIGLMGARTAGRHWPPDGVVPPGATVDAFGYVSDHDVAARAVDEIEAAPSFLFVHLNGADTVAHLYGPSSEEALESYRAIDDALSILESHLRPSWNDHVVLVTSDHGQEAVDPAHRVDLRRTAEKHGADATVVHEGTAALVSGPDAADLRWLETEEGIEGWTRIGDASSLVFTNPGWWFASPSQPERRGAHGGRRTTRTVAVATGNPAAVQVARTWFRRAGLSAADWRYVVEEARVAAET